MELWFLVFAVLVFAVILAGVKNGVERVSRVMMPMMIVLAVVVAVYSVTRPGAVEGIKYFLIPNLEHFSIMTVVAALSLIHILFRRSSTAGSRSSVSLSVC